jgi:solute carrier family 25 oxoglutarate transporter 11
MNTVLPVRIHAVQNKFSILTSMSTDVGSSSMAAGSVAATTGGQTLLDRPLTKALLPFIIGGSSGMVATTCIQPIDMVKVRLQLAGEGTKGGPRASPISVAREIIAQGGVLNLYSGLSAGYLRQIVYGTARLGLFGTFIDLFEKRAETKGTKIGFAERSLAGLGAGSLGAMIGNPAEVVLIRMQSDGLKPEGQRVNYRSAFDALARITRNEGIRALWSGAYPTVIRAMAANFGQLTFFSESKNQLQKYTTFSTQATTLTASSIAGFFGALFSLPLDMVKTRLQRQTRGPDGSVPYKGMLDCFVKVAKNEGLLRFYRGFGPYFFRMAPHS